MRSRASQHDVQATRQQPQYGGASPQFAGSPQQHARMRGTPGPTQPPTPPGHQ